MATSTFNPNLPGRTGKDIAYPDLVLSPGDEVVNNPGGLDPCPACDSRPHEAPEGVHDFHSAAKHPGANAGDPKWNFPHCWKCGFRPGTNVAVSQARLASEFAAFARWRDEQIERVFNENPKAPTLEQQIETLDEKTKAQLLEKLQAEAEATKDAGS